MKRSTAKASKTATPARVAKKVRARAVPASRAAAKRVVELVDLVRRRTGRPARVEAHEDRREAWIDVRFSLAEVERWLRLGRHLRAVS
jgi:hypothetical protein